MRSYTHRELVEINGELDRCVSWKAFVSFLQEKTAEYKAMADGESEDITKLLRREQYLGAEKALETLFKEFSFHVVDKLKSTKQEENSNG